MRPGCASLDARPLLCWYWFEQYLGPAADDEHRTMCVVHDGHRDAAVPEPTQRSPAMRADHDHLPGLPLGRGADRLSDRARYVHQRARDPGLGCDVLRLLEGLVDVLPLDLRHLRDEIGIAE